MRPVLLEWLFEVFSVDRVGHADEDKQRRQEDKDKEEEAEAEVKPFAVKKDEEEEGREEEGEGKLIRSKRQEEGKQCKNKRPRGLHTICQLREAVGTHSSIRSAVGNRACRIPMKLSLMTCNDTSVPMSNVPMNIPQVNVFHRKAGKK